MWPLLLLRSAAVGDVALWELSALTEDCDSGRSSMWAMSSLNTRSSLPPGIFLRMATKSVQDIDAMPEICVASLRVLAVGAATDGLQYKLQQH